MWTEGAAENDIIIAQIEVFLAVGKVPDVSSPDRNSTRQGFLGFAKPRSPLSRCRNILCGDEDESGRCSQGDGNFLSGC